MPAEPCSVEHTPHDRQFWRHAIGARRPDGTAAEGPMGYGSTFWAWVGRPSRETRERNEREARRTAALDAARQRSARRRRATPAPALTALVTPIGAARSLRARKAGRIYALAARGRRA